MINKQVDLVDKKWNDLIESNRKMLNYARQELEQGNILNAKSILDSLKKNHALRSGQYPEEFKETFEELFQSMAYSQN